MGIVFRQSIKTTIVTLTGAALGALIVFANTKFLSQTEYGLSTNIVLTGAVIQLLVIMGTANLISVYTQRYAYEDERRKALLTIGLLATFVGTVIFTILFFLLKESILDIYRPEDRVLIRQYYYLVPVLVLLWSMVTIFDQYLVAHVKIAISAFSREVILRVANIILLGLISMGIISFHQYVISNVLTYVIPLVTLIIVSSKTKGFGLTKNFRVFSLAEYKDMLHFSWYHLLVGSSLMLLNYIDTLMLGPLDSSGIKVAAIYTVAVFIASVMYMPYRAMATSSLPILNEAFIERDMPKVADLFKRAGVNIMIVGVGTFVLIAINMDNAVAILPSEYASVKPLVLILIIGKLIDMATGLNNELISISRYYKFNFRVALFLLVMVFTLDRIFIPEYGTMGAAVVATCSVIVFNLLKMIFLYRKLKLHPFTDKTWLVFVAGALAGLIAYFLPFIFHPVADTVIRSMVFMVTYVLMLIWLKPSPDLSVYLDNIKKNKRLF